jgi:hypothetical protein
LSPSTFSIAFGAIHGIIPIALLTITSVRNIVIAAIVSAALIAIDRRLYAQSTA